MDSAFPIIFSIVLGLSVLAVFFFLRNKKQLIARRNAGELDYIDDEYLLFIADVDDASFIEFNKVPVLYKKNKGNATQYSASISASSNGIFVNFNNSFVKGMYDGIFLFGAQPTKRFAPRSTAYLWRVENQNNELFLELSYSEHIKSHRVYLIIENPNTALQSLFEQLPKANTSCK